MRLLSFFRGLSRRSLSFGEGRRGFTMVELLTVTAIMGTLARMAVPDLHRTVMKAEAATVVGDFETVRVAAFNYHADHLRWPEDGYTGVVPSGLAPYLPQGFSFIRQGYRLDWENWELPDGLPGQPDTGVLLGISIVTSDRELAQAVMNLLGPNLVHYTFGDRYTFVVERM